MMDVGRVMVDPFRAMWDRLAAFVPTLLAAILILVIGWLIAKVIEKVIVNVLKAIRVDFLSERAGIADFLAKGEIKYTLSELIGILIYWILLLVVFVTAANALNLQVSAALLDKVVFYIPNVIAAVFILVIGMFFATLMANVVRSAATHIGIGQSKLLGQVTQAAIIIFAILVTLDQLKIATTSIVLAINIILAALGLAVALAFGLGCKDIAGKAVANFLDKLKK